MVSLIRVYGEWVYLRGGGGGGGGGGKSMIFFFASFLNGCHHLQGIFFSSSKVFNLRVKGRGGGGSTFKRKNLFLQHRK